MTSGISAIALFAPVVASNAVFSVRRASRGVDAMAENPVYGAMNMDIAAGQTLKGARAVKALACVSNPAAEESFSGAADAIRGLSQSNKLLNGVGKIINFTADNINPIICLTSGVKVLGSDDKVDAAARESLALGTMFGSEALAKEILGLSRKKNVNGKKQTVVGDGLYKKNLFLKEQSEAIKDFCETKKLFNKYSLKMLPGVAKGLLFVSASIMGYQLGSVIADAILGEKKAS